MVRREVLGLQSDPRSPEQGQYTFLQDLLRHVAYETLPRRERREKHLAAADHLSATLGEDEVAEVIASHLLDAYRLDPEAVASEGLRRRAHGALLRAGERAASLGASTEAQRYFEQAAELSQEPHEQADALMRAGEMAATAGETDDSCKLFEQAIGLYQASGDTHGAARASSWLGLSEQRLGRIDSAIERMEQAYAVISHDEPDARPRIPTQPPRRRAFLRRQSRACSRIHGRALDLAEALQLARSARPRLDHEVILSLSLAHPEEARGLLQLALETALQHELYPNAASAYGNLSDLALQRDRYPESLSHLEQALELARRIGNRPQEWFALSEMTYSLTMLGRWDEALSRFGELPEEQLGISIQPDRPSGWCAGDLPPPRPA